MKKKYKISLISLIATFTAIVIIAVCMLFARPAAAFATDRAVTIDGSNVFYTTINGAEVTNGMEVKVIHGEEGTADKEEEHYYTLFKIGEDETVAYRKSLAYSWKSGKFDDKGNPTGEYGEHMFTMTIGFDAVNFSRFIIKFQSQQYLNTEDDITTNYLVFAPVEDEENAVKVAAVQDLEKEINYYPVSYSTADHARIEISFTRFESGTVDIGINGAGTDQQFKNVYFPYANYVASGDKAVTPLTFSAEFEEGATADGELTADMKLYELNGQSFELFAHDNDGIYNDAMDNTPPVICFIQTPSYVEFGKTIDFDYVVIDVLASSPRATACFYVLTGEQYSSDEFDYMQIVYDEKKEDEEDDGDDSDSKLDEYPFIKVSSGSDIRVIRDSKTFVPSVYLKGGAAYSENYNVYGLIKVYFEITDVTGSTAQTDKVFVDWYAKPDAVVNIYTADYKGAVDDELLANKGNFLKIIDGKEGVSYFVENPDMPEYSDILGEYKNQIELIRASYQAKIEAAIAELEDGKLYAGGDSNFYLPEFDLITYGDQYFDVKDYKFSIYYKGKTTGTNVSLSYNGLSIPLSDADANYRFTFFVTDAFGNPMRYPYGYEDGKIVWKEIRTEDIWKEDFADLLPFFEFNVSYKKATAENPESLTVAYVGTSYGGVSFSIKDSAKTSTAHYDLYIFNRNGAYKDLGLDLSYAKFVENYEALFGNTYKENMDTRKYFTTVKPGSALTESDANYSLFKSINWKPDSVTFTPQSAEDFYIVRLTLTDNRSQKSDVYFATVSASIQANPLKGEDNWVQNNVAAIVLLSVAGVLFIAFVVLLIAKPKDKGDIDEIYENEAKGKNSKKKAKKSK